jgi:hypothetical protein
MGAGMNVQKRLVAAHHLDAPWRPSDLEQRNGRIIRQGNMLYERAPDNFNVGIYYYATKQTYDSRMWQTIEYKAAAIEQFRKGDLLQRVIDDVQSEAANAAEMKAAASGNPLILMQVKLASDLRKLEALYSQHQRSQHRLKDRLRWLGSAQERMDATQAVYNDNCKRRDSHTRVITEKGKERIMLEFTANGQILREKDSEKIKAILREAVNDVIKKYGHRPLFGAYRGFDVYVLGIHSALGTEGFCFMLKGSGDKEFHPNNLEYSLDDKFSLSGLFQRLDNFLDKGLEQAFQNYKANVARDMAELETVKSALGQEFPQKDALTLTRENHGAVMRELQRMQNEPEYVSAWEPKTSLSDTPESQGKIKHIAIIGSRSFNDYPVLESIVMNMLNDKGVKLSDLTVISGGAKGADSLGREFSQKHGTQYKEFLPDWEQFGKRAGFVRNAEIVKNSDYVIAFWDGQSKGTRNSLEVAQNLGTPYYAYNFVTKEAVTLTEQEKPPQEPSLPAGDTEQDSPHEEHALNEGNKFMDAGFHANYDQDGSVYSYNKRPYKIDDGGEIIISVKPRESGAFAVRAEYEKDHILDARRNHVATASSVDEALEVVASFEKYLLPETARVVEQAAPTPGLRLR